MSLIENINIRSKIWKCFKFRGSVVETFIKQLIDKKSNEITLTMKE